MTYRPHFQDPDGRLPHELGHAWLASGSLAYVEPNGEVSQIVHQDDLHKADDA